MGQRHTCVYTQRMHTHTHTHTHAHTHRETCRHRQYRLHASNRRVIRKSCLPKREFALGFWVGHFVWVSHQSIPVLLLQNIPWQYLLDMYHVKTPNWGPVVIVEELAIEIPINQALTLIFRNTSLLMSMVDATLAIPWYMNVVLFSTIVYIKMVHFCPHAMGFFVYFSVWLLWIVLV